MRRPGRGFVRRKMTNQSYSERRAEDCNKEYEELTSDEKDLLERRERRNPIVIPTRMWYEAKMNETLRTRI